MLILGLGGIAPAFAQEASESELVKTGDEMLQSAARLRGLEPKGPIQQGVKDKAEISRYLNERVQAEYAPGEIEKEGKILRTLGLIPESNGLQGHLLSKLLTEQVGGYYDSDKKTFFIASWLPSEEQKPVMIHELTHALQDQHFDVAKMLKEDRVAAERRPDTGASGGDGRRRHGCDAAVFPGAGQKAFFTGAGPVLHHAGPDGDHAAAVSGFQGSAFVFEGNTALPVWARRIFPAVCLAQESFVGGRKQNLLRHARLDRADHAS